MLLVNLHPIRPTRSHVPAGPNIPFRYSAQPEPVLLTLDRLNPAYQIGSGVHCDPLVFACSDCMISDRSMASGITNPSL
jgi:hypothetical protein